MGAFSAYFRNLGRKRQLKFQNLFPEILSVLPPVKETGDSEELSSALVALIDLASTAPKMFKPHFPDLVGFCVTVIQDKELDNTCRQNALEFLATFADYAPSMCRKTPAYTEQMITQCLSLMTDLGKDDEDASEWMSTDDVSRECCFSGRGGDGVVVVVVVVGGLGGSAAAAAPAAPAAVAAWRLTMLHSTIEPPGNNSR